MTLLIRNGTTNVILRVSLRRLSTGGAFTGLTNSSSGLLISGIADVELYSIGYAQAANQIETIAQLGLYEAPSASKCRFKEVDATNHPGLYEIHLANARLGVGAAKKFYVAVSGVSDLKNLNYEIAQDIPAVDSVLMYGGDINAARLSIASGLMLPGSVDDAAFSPTTSEFESSDVSYPTGFWKVGQQIIMRSGLNENERSWIYAYTQVGGRGHYKVSPPFLNAPVNGGLFILT